MVPARAGGPGPAAGSHAQALGALERRAAELLGSAGPPSGRPKDKALSLQDAAQLWYGLNGLQHPWGEPMLRAAAAATVACLEDWQPGGGAQAPAEGASRAAQARTGSAPGRRPIAEDSAAAQLLFRMGAVLGRGALQAPCAADSLAQLVGRAAEQPGGPACPEALLAGAQLLGLPLSAACVRELHTAALWQEPRAAAAAGRTALARGLHAAVGLGLQPTAAEADAWEAQLLRRLAGPWRAQELGWVLRALSGARAYTPGPEAREALCGALRVCLRSARANDLSRMRPAVTAWRLSLPPRERSLLAARLGGDEEPPGAGDEAGELRAWAGEGPRAGRGGAWQEAETGLGSGDGPERPRPSEEWQRWREASREEGEDEGEAGWRGRGGEGGSGRGGRGGWAGGRGRRGSGGRGRGGGEGGRRGGGDARWERRHW